MVGAPRFELGTSWSRTKRATRLRYAPTRLVLGTRSWVLGQSCSWSPSTQSLDPSTRFLVGTGRFELPTPCTPSKCATRLRYVPSKAGTGGCVLGTDQG